MTQRFPMTPAGLDKLRTELERIKERQAELAARMAYLEQRREGYGES